jgi:uncharacterized protein YbjT (DUF2867 family)
MYLVTGATGNAGGELVRALAAAGEPVRALVRDAGRANLPAGVDVVEGDLNRPESVASALGGVRGAFLLAGYDRMPDTLAELRRAGVERVVLLSASSVLSTDEDNAVSAYHRASEAAVRESGLAWTFLRPHTFMSNALRWIEQLRAGDVVREAFGDLGGAGGHRSMAKAVVRLRDWRAAGLPAGEREMADVIVTRFVAALRAGRA